MLNVLFRNTLYLIFCYALLSGCENKKNPDTALPNLNIKTFDYKEVIQQQKALCKKIANLKVSDQ